MPRLLSRPADITGAVFGRLTVIGREPNLGQNTAWRCRCSCGNECVVRRPHLETGRTVSCGCYRRESSAARRKALLERPRPRCSVAGCAKPRSYRDMCGMHARRQERYGEATFVTPEIDEMLARRSAR